MLSKTSIASNINLGGLHLARHGDLVFSGRWYSLIFSSGMMHTPPAPCEPYMMVPSSRLLVWTSQTTSVSRNSVGDWLFSIRTIPSLLERTENCMRVRIGTGNAAVELLEHRRMLNGGDELSISVFASTEVLSIDSATAAEIADFNADGITDLVIASQRVAVLLGDGSTLVPLQQSFTSRPVDRFSSTTIRIQMFSSQTRTMTSVLSTT